MPARTVSVYVDVLEEYMAEKGLDECVLADALRWGIAENRLQMSPQGQLSYHLRRARKALREKKCTTPSGRHVREWHHRKTRETNGDGDLVQHDFWGNICRMSHASFLESLRQRCKAASVDIKQIEKDRDGFNEFQASKGLPGVQLTIKFSYR